MHVLKPFVLVAALAAAPAADAGSVCDAIRHAAQIGASDNRFAAFRQETPAPEGFACQINVEGDLAAYACSIPVAPEARVATTSALIGDIRACVASSLIAERNPKASNAVFMISRKPRTWVVINGADDDSRIHMNVVVARRPPPRAWGQPGTNGFGSTPSSDIWPPFDPGREKPHFNTK